jgi:ferrous iron transport protein A
MFTQGFSVYYSPLNFLDTQTEAVITAIRNKDDNIIKKLLAMGIYFLEMGI